MQSGSEGRGGGRGGSRGGRGSRDSGDRGRGRGRGGSRGGGRGRGRSQAPATSLGVQKGGKLRSLKNQIRGVERLLRKVSSCDTAPFPFEPLPRNAISNTITDGATGACAYICAQILGHL